jgi:hypothetical protein
VWAIVPVIQFFVFFVLCYLPSRDSTETAKPSELGGLPRAAWKHIAQGVLAGVILTILSVALGALLFGTYGYGMFIVTPLLVGAVTAYFANREYDIGAGRTANLAMATTLLGGSVLILVALEGLVCLVLVAPLGIGLAAVGSVLGRLIARRRRPHAGQVMSTVIVLPILFALEALFPASLGFETNQSISIDADAQAVWKAIVKTDTITELPALPFRLGMAYPMSGEVVGTGVGAIRRGVFSTGTVIERVTEWEPERALAYTVVEDVPAMRELSLYENVHAPHVIGYFRTVEMSYELVAKSEGRTELVLRSSHELRLDPAPYWLPMARLIVALNNGRVLRHMKRQAEQDH